MEYVEYMKKFGEGNIVMWKSDYPTICHKCGKKITKDMEYVSDEAYHLYHPTCLK